ncbi:unnamed protein product [Laminaria digitata]
MYPIMVLCTNNSGNERVPPKRRSVKGGLNGGAMAHTYLQIRIHFLHCCIFVFVFSDSAYVMEGPSAFIVRRQVQRATMLRFVGTNKTRRLGVAERAFAHGRRVAHDTRHMIPVARPVRRRSYFLGALGRKRVITG